MSGNKKITPEEMAAMNKDASSEQQATTKPSATDTVKAPVTDRMSPKTSQNVQQLRNLLARFEELKNGDTRPVFVGKLKQSHAERCIRALSAAFSFVHANQNDNEVINELRVFFVKHRDGILSTTSALQGMNFIFSNKTEYDRISIMFILMFELTNPSRGRKDYDLEFATKVLTNPKCSVPNGFVDYVSVRMN